MTLARGPVSSNHPDDGIRTRVNLKPQVGSASPQNISGRRLDSKRKRPCDFSQGLDPNRDGGRDKDRTCDPYDVNVVDRTPARQITTASTPKNVHSTSISNSKVGRKLGSWTDGLEIRMRGPNRDQPSYVIKTSPRLMRAKEQAFEASLVGRLTAVVDAKNLCSILDPLRRKIRMPTAAADTVVIENLVVIYAISQILKLDRDQWNQFCLSEHCSNTGVDLGQIQTTVIRLWFSCSIMRLRTAMLLRSLKV